MPDIKRALHQHNSDGKLVGTLRQELYDRSSTTGVLCGEVLLFLHHDQTYALKCR